MICRACTQGDCLRCDDVTRYERVLDWADLTVTDAYAAERGTTREHLIRVNQPYDACPCQHGIESYDPAVAAYDQLARPWIAATPLATGRCPLLAPHVIAPHSPTRPSSPAPHQQT